MSVKHITVLEGKCEIEHDWEINSSYHKIIIDYENISDYFEQGKKYKVTIEEIKE